MRSQLDLSPEAWLGALEQALPFFSGDKGVCPPPAELSGSDQDDLHQWQPLLDYGLRTGEQLRSAWATLQERANQLAQYFGEEVTGRALLCELQPGIDYLLRPKLWVEVAGEFMTSVGDIVIGKIEPTTTQPPQTPVRHLRQSLAP